MHDIQKERWLRLTGNIRHSTPLSSRQVAQFVQRIRVRVQQLQVAHSQIISTLQNPQSLFQILQLLLFILRRGDTRTHLIGMCLEKLCREIE